jgi:hypothetical protein
MGGMGLQSVDFLDFDFELFIEVQGLAYDMLEENLV